MPVRIQAAFGKIAITPEEKTPLQGYDPDTHIADPAHDVLDELYARILLLDDGVQRKAIVSVDCCLTNEETVHVSDPAGKPGVYRQFIPTFPAGTRQKWAEAAKTDINGISVHGTHTHTAPAHYSEKYTERIEKLIGELEDRLVPVRLSVGTGESKVSAFRRPTLQADLSVPVNQSLKVLMVDTENGDPLGMIVNYAVHPTALRNPAARLSGDIVGLAVSHVEEQMGTGYTALFMQGFSGDICPLFGDNGPKEDTYPDVVRGSKVLGSDILSAMGNKQEIEVTDFRSSSRTVSFPTREHFYKPETDATLFGLSLGDIAILAVSGEVFNAYMDKLVTVSPFHHTFLSGIANGYSGYMPTKHAFRDGLGGYEMNTTPYTEELEDLFVREASELLLSLRLNSPPSHSV